MNSESNLEKITNSDVLHKILLVGDNGVGKSTILKRLQHKNGLKKIDSNTELIDLGVCNCAVKILPSFNHINSSIQVVFWDSGTSPSDSLLKIYLERTELVILVLTTEHLDSQCIQKQKKWIDRVQRLTDFKKMMKIGVFLNKIDSLKDAEMIPFKMSLAAQQLNVQHYAFGSAKNNDLDSLLTLSKRAVEEFQQGLNNTFGPELDKFCWLQFVLRNHIDRFLFENSMTQQTELHIPIKLPQFDDVTEGSTEWSQISDVAHKTIMDIVDSRSNKKTFVCVSVTKINRPSGVDVSRSTVLISFWLNVTSTEEKPVYVDETNQTCVIEDNQSSCLLM